MMAMHDVLCNSLRLITELRSDVDATVHTILHKTVYFTAQFMPRNRSHTSGRRWINSGKLQATQHTPPHDRNSVDGENPCGFYLQVKKAWIQDPLLLINSTALRRSVQEFEQLSIDRQGC